MNSNSQTHIKFESFFRLWRPHQAHPFERPGPFLLLRSGRHSCAHLQRAEHSATRIQVNIEGKVANLTHISQTGIIRSIKSGEISSPIPWG